MAYRDTLSGYDDAWDHVPEPGELPEGTWAAQVTRAEIRASTQDPSRLFLVLRFATDVGESDLVLALTDERRLAMTKRQLRALGFGGRLSELEDWLETAVGLGAEITVKHHNGYTNIYVDRRIELAPLGAGPDVPF